MTPSRFSVDPHVLDNSDLSKPDVMRSWQQRVAILLEQLMSGIIQLPPNPSSGVYLDGTGNWSTPAGGGGGGDMLKSVYDTNNNGVVDTADSLAWSKLTGVPSTFTPAAHAPTHITGGSDVIPAPTTSASGLVPVLPGNTTTFLRGDGAWGMPSAGAPSTSLTDLGAATGNSTIDTGQAFLIAVNMVWAQAANWTLTLQNVALGSQFYLRFLNMGSAPRSFTVSALSPSSATYTIRVYVPGSNPMTGTFSVNNGNAINLSGVSYTVAGNPTIQLFGFGGTG